MKSQMQIVQEAIARMEQMSRDEFATTLVASGLAEPRHVHHHIFTHTVRVVDFVDISSPPNSIRSFSLESNADGSALSLVF